MCESSWNLLRRLREDQLLPWLVGGDFNEIAFSYEKSDGRLRSERRMDMFRSALMDCDLSDLGYQGSCIRGSMVNSRQPISVNRSIGELPIMLGDTFSQIFLLNIWCIKFQTTVLC